MMLTTQAASQKQAFPLAGTLNRLSLSELHTKHRDSPSLPVRRNLWIKLNCAETEKLANSLILAQSCRAGSGVIRLLEIEESTFAIGGSWTKSLIIWKNAVGGCREIKGEHYRYSGSGKEKGSAENTTLEMLPFLIHEENQRSSALDYKIKHDSSNLRNDNSNLSHEVNQQLAEQYVRTCETFVGHRVTVSKPVQPFGSMPRDCSSFLSIRLIQVASDASPSCLACSSNCARKSSGSRIWYCGDLFSFSIDMVVTGAYYHLHGNDYCNYSYHIKQRPVVLVTHTGRLTKPLYEVTIIADIKSTPTRFKFLFLAVHRSDLNAKPHRESVTAHTEQDARRSLAGQFVLFFAGRLPEVSHA